MIIKTTLKIFCDVVTVIEFWHYTWPFYDIIHVLIYEMYVNDAFMNTYTPSSNHNEIVLSLIKWLVGYILWLAERNNHKIIPARKMYTNNSDIFVKLGGLLSVMVSYFKAVVIQIK